MRYGAFLLYYFIIAVLGRTNILLESQIKKVENEAIINFKLK